MLAVRSLDASTEKYLLSCMRAYFEGQTLNWMLGVIGGAKRSIPHHSGPHHSGNAVRLVGEHREISRGRL